MPPPPVILVPKMVLRWNHCRLSSLLLDPSGVRGTVTSWSNNYQGLTLFRDFCDADGRRLGIDNINYAALSDNALLWGELPDYHDLFVWDEEG